MNISELSRKFRKSDNILRQNRRYKGKINFRQHFKIMNINIRDNLMEKINRVIK